MRSGPSEKIMDIDARRKMGAILRVLDRSESPLGSALISRKLAESGVELCERMVRYYLEVADSKGLTKNLGRRGRVITDLGCREMDATVALDKVGFVNSRIDELAYRMTFDEATLSGTLVINISVVNTRERRRTLKEVSRVMQARLGVGKFVLETNFPEQILRHVDVPEHHITIGTVCGVTLNGVLLNHGITMINRFGGLLDLVDGTPVRFSHIIDYAGSTVDPLEVFIKSKMTSVDKAARTGAGCIGASFREISVAALPAARAVIDRLEEIGLSGVIMIGKPNQPLLDIPVSAGHVGLIVAGGLNPIAAIEEAGTPTLSRAMFNLCEFERLRAVGMIAGR